MDFQSISLAAVGRRRGFSSSSSASSPTSSPSRPSLKRKLEGGKTYAMATVPVDGDDGSGGAAVESFARVEAVDEVSVLRKAMASHKETIQQLLEELEEERNAGATAAIETMAMIIRLQHEKAEIDMEARNFRRLAEEKIVHDQDELDNLEGLLFKREEAIHYLTFQVEAYRHRLRSHGIDPSTMSAAAFDQFDDPTQFDDVLVDDYPPLKCTVPNHGGDVDGEEQVYTFLEAPPGKCKSDDWELPAEASPDSSFVMEKGIVVQSPENYILNGLRPEKEKDGIPFTMDLDVTDRVCIIDKVDVIRTSHVSEGFSDSSKQKNRKGKFEEETVDIQNLYLRLQALEEDRELMKQAIVSMPSEKAQLMLLKEMAQQLKEAAQQKKMAKKPLNMTFFHVFISFTAKWIAPFHFWRKKARQTKYTFGISSNNVGLMLAVDRSPEITY